MQSAVELAGGLAGPPPLAAPAWPGLPAVVCDGVADRDGVVLAAPALHPHGTAIRTAAASAPGSRVFIAGPPPGA